MAGFKTHITTSTVLGVGYGAVGAYYGLPWESAVIAGGLCGVGGMLPDIDSDSGVPFRESMGFAAAVTPMLLLPRFAELGLNYEQMVLAVGCCYVFVRFGVARLLARYTVHRGMFHSLPAALIFAGLAFMFSGSNNLQLRYFKAAGVLLGVLSHLVLDEIYAVEWKGGRWRFKRSFGTALKLWGPSAWGNISTYAKLILVITMILGEPMVMERYGQLSPVVLDRNRWHDELAQHPAAPAPSEGIFPPQATPQGFTSQTPGQAVPSDGNVDRTVYDTARRIWRTINGSPDVQK